MKKIMLLLFTVFVMLSCSHKPGWKLVWEENFDGTELDTTMEPYPSGQGRLAEHTIFRRPLL